MYIYNSSLRLSLIFSREVLIDICQVYLYQACIYSVFTGINMNIFYASFLFLLIIRFINNAAVSKNNYVCLPVRLFVRKTISLFN